MSNSASTEQLSLPLRMSVRSARWPRIKFRAPMRIDLPAPVSPVMILIPGCSSTVRSAARARFLMRSVVNMPFLFALNLAYATVEQKKKLGLTD